MNKKLKRFLTLSSISAAFVGILVCSSKIELYKNDAVECSHVGYHYGLVNATTTEGGHFEFWTCCKCHQNYLIKPSGSFTDASIIQSGGLPASCALPAGTKYYAKGAKISNDSVFDPKVNDISSLDGMAISFDFKMIENGTIGLALFATDWANVTGDITFTKSNDNVTCNLGTVTPKDNGWYNVIINRNDFVGDGLARATNIGIVSGLWGGSETVDSPVALAVNWATFQVTSPTRKLVTGNDAMLNIGKITKTELQNKALSFNAYFGASGDQTIKFGLYKDGWDNYFAIDFFLKRVGSGYELRQYDPNGTPLACNVSEIEPNWVNVEVDSSEFEIKSDYGNKIVVWSDPTTSSNGVDINSFKAVDYVPVISRTYNVDDANIQTFTNIIMMKDLINTGAYTFNVKMTPNTTSKFTFMNGNWSNFGTSIFYSDSSGNISCYHEDSKTNPKGKLTRLSSGWTNVIFNESDFTGDGRSADGAEGVNYVFVQNGAITIDEASCKYCSPYVETGVTFATGVTIDHNSWDSGHRNFSYVKDHVLRVDTCLAFDFKPVGNGNITMSLLADTWANISGNFVITKNGDDISCDYPDSVIIAREDGWYSIYLPAPLLGDGIDSAWTPLCKVFSQAGYSGTSFTINFDSIHIAHSSFLGGKIELSKGEGCSVAFENVGAAYYRVYDDNSNNPVVVINGDTSSPSFSYTPEVVGQHEIYVEAFNDNNKKIATSSKIMSVEVEPVFSYAPFSSHFYIYKADMAKYGITQALWDKAASEQGSGQDGYYFFLDKDLNWTTNGALSGTSDSYDIRDEVDFSNSIYLDTIISLLKETGQNVVLLHTKYAMVEQYTGWSWWYKNDSNNACKRYMDAFWNHGMKCIISDGAIYNTLNALGRDTASEADKQSIKTNVQNVVTSRLLHSNSGESNLQNLLFHKGFYGLNVCDEPFPNSRAIYGVGYMSQTINSIYANHGLFKGKTKPVVFTCLLPYAKNIDVFNSDTDYQNYIEQWLDLTETNYFNFDLYNYRTMNYGVTGTITKKYFCPIKASYNIFETLHAERPGLKITQTINCGNCPGCQEVTVQDIFACHLSTAAAKFYGYGLFTFSQFDLSSSWENEAITAKLEKNTSFNYYVEANQQVTKIKGLLDGYDITNMTFTQDDYGGGVKKMDVTYSNGSATRELIVNYESDSSVSASKSNFKVTVPSGKQYILFGQGKNINEILTGSGNSVTLSKGTALFIL